MVVGESNVVNGGVDNVNGCSGSGSGGGGGL